jgi:hypothetical protein
VAKGVIVVVGWAHPNLPIQGMISYKIIKNKPFGDLPPRPNKRSLWGCRNATHNSSRTSAAA